MKPTTYKAAIFRDAGKVEVIDLPYPHCGDSDIIVKNLMAGFCGSDLSAFRHGGDPHMIWKDHEFGHEMISEVIEVGKDVKDVQVGDYVFPNMGYAKNDRRRMATVGGFSEYIHIPQCVVGGPANLGKSIIKIDKSIPIKSAVLLEPFVIGSRGAKSLNPGPGKTAIVFGAGIIGMSAAIMLKWWGCDKVMIVDISDFRLENAKKFGLITCNSAKEDLKAKAIAEFGGGPGMFGETCNANLYLDALGIQAAEDNFMALAGREASLAVVGVHHKPVTMNFVQVCYSNWHIGGAGNTPLEVLAVEIVEMMKSGKYDVSSLVSHEYRLGQVVEAITMSGNSTEAQKVCISYL